MSPIIAALVGLFLFVAGQYYQKYRDKKMVEFYANLSQTMLKKYHDGVKACVEKRGIDFGEIERELISNELKETIEKMVAKVMPNVQGVAQVEVREGTKEEVEALIAKSKDDDKRTLN